MEPLSSRQEDGFLFPTVTFSVLAQRFGCGSRLGYDTS